MIILRLHSILAMLLTLYVIASSKGFEDRERMILGLMYIPVLVYLLNGGN